MRATSSSASSQRTRSSALNAPILETDRLVICNWLTDDWRLIRPMTSDPIAMQYIGHYQPWSDEETRQFVRNRISDYHQHGWTMWPLVLKTNGDLVGYCGFLERWYGEYQGEIEIGYAIDRASWGQGLAAEAGRRILDYGFQTFRFHRVIASARPENDQSIRVMEKLGMTPIGRSPNPSGRRVPSTLSKILPHDQHPTRTFPSSPLHAL